jgi:hypothetical protein
MNNRFIIDLWNLCHITNILNQTLLIDILGYCACQIYQYQRVQGVLDTTLCDKVCQWLVAGRWFSLSNPISSTNKTDCHDITEILLKVALNINQSINQPKVKEWVSDCSLTPSENFYISW